jgi:protein-S-isoprenylcysteine O-methyltransferase Ste14
MTNPIPDKFKDFFINTLPTIILLSYYGLFAYAHISNYLSTGRTSSIFIAILESMVVIMVLMRQRPKTVTTAPEDWLVAIGMTVSPLFLMPSPIGHEFWLFQILQIIGVLVSIGGLLTLSTSFGIVAAKRTLKSDGLYKYVRHPMYAGYSISLPAFVVQNPTLLNFIAISIFFGLLFIRVQAEERLLSQDPVYATYMTQTKWRIFPGIW